MMIKLLIFLSFLLIIIIIRTELDVELITRKKKTYCLAGFADLANHRGKIKETEANNHELVYVYKAKLATIG